MVYIVKVHISGGSGHEHIAEVGWVNPENNETGKTTVSDMVKWLNGKGVAKVSDGTNTVNVAVVDGNPPFIRTHADGKWTNNLLALPRY